MATPVAFPGASGTQGQDCIKKGKPCAGGTQDTYSYPSQNIGELSTTQPAFVVGVDHSSSVDDSTNPINNALYTGLSTNIAQQNIGITDVIETNVAATFSLNSMTPPPADYLEGSGVAVVNFLNQDSKISPPPSTALLNDAQNLYVAAVVRLTSAGACEVASAYFCDPAYPFVTYIGSSSSSASPPYIPVGDNVALTERGYLLPATSNPSPPATGANPSYIEPPYVLYDTNPS